jgi:two-component system sensor histidine kinase DesK
LAIGLVLVLIYLPVVVYQVAIGGLPLWHRALLIAGIVAYAVGWLGLPLVFWRLTTMARRTVLCVALTLLGLAVVAGLGIEAASLMVYVMSSTAIVLSFPRALIINGVVLLLLVGAMQIEGVLAADGNALGTLLSVSLGMTFVGRLVRVNDELERARDQIASLAVAEERNRLGRDLHDILGHSLTTITVKAGLARRLLESSGDTGRAQEEIREVEELSRQALGDIRATVAGYREMSLSAEVVGARAALRAAGVETDLPHAIDNVRPELQGVFGYVLREGVTNVLRHSGATRCEVRLGDTWLEMRDNGKGTGDSTPGTGLSGLAERLDEVGGKLDAGPLPDGGYRLRVEVA